MSVSLRAVNQRDKGELPLSIGTSLAIESACGLGEEFYTEHPAINEVDEVWVNLRTLFRNLYGSIERNVRDSLLPEDLMAGLLDDIRTMEATITRKTHGRVQLVFYICDFSDFKQQFPNAYYKELKTEKQKIEQSIENQTLRLLVEDSPPIDLRQFQTRIEGDGKRILMLTHYPIDLLWKKDFAELRLLESHTGKIKSQVDWYTKLTGGKDLTRIPFNRLTIQVFGDGNTLFASMPQKLKQELIDLSIQYKWTPLTTEEKVRYGLGRIYDPRVKTFYTSLL